MSSSLRKRILPAGWYPASKNGVTEMLDEWKKEWEQEGKSPSKNAVSAIVPHAGWAFSGKLAFKTMLYIGADYDTVVVVGGHMAAGEGVVAAEESGFETPLGDVENDGELVRAIAEEMHVGSDRVPDNTVEVNLPFVKYLFPKSRVVWLRTGAGDEAKRAGKACAAAAGKLGRKVCLVGSTDLTHYGPSYGFMPKGRGEAAFRWAKDENDASVIEAMVSMDADEVLRLGNSEKAACSSGAAAAAVEFARASGVTSGRLVGYASSHDLHPGDSFVGYAGIIYDSDAS